MQSHQRYYIWTQQVAPIGAGLINFLYNGTSCWRLTRHQNGGHTLKLDCCFGSLAYSIFQMRWWTTIIYSVDLRYDENMHACTTTETIFMLLNAWSPDSVPYAKKAEGSFRIPTLELRRGTKLKPWAFISHQVPELWSGAGKWLLSVRFNFLTACARRCCQQHGRGAHRCKGKHAGGWDAARSDILQLVWSSF